MVLFARLYKRQQETELCSCSSKLIQVIFLRLCIYAHANYLVNVTVENPALCILAAFTYILYFSIACKRNKNPFFGFSNTNYIVELLNV